MTNIQKSGEISSVEQSLVEVRLDAIRFGARDINLYDLARIDGKRLPSFNAGAHIDLHLPGGIVRQYSLVQSACEDTAYTIGVKREPASRGGSSYLHDKVRVGNLLKISAPRNNFPLCEEADHSVLIAGGIGITPIYAMWRRLTALGRSVELFYSCRSRSDALFLNELEHKRGIRLHFDDHNPGEFLDLQSIVKSVPRDTHFYCCGPAPMLSAFETATADLPLDQVHLESFATRDAAATEGGFIVELARSGKLVRVKRGQTILAALTAAGMDAPSSCEEGICGACTTGVLEGIPDHRDSVLSPAERQRNNRIIICCSGSKSPKLRLDM